VNDPSTLWNFIADYGDLGALLPGLCAICVILCSCGKLREACVWCGAFAGCLTLTLLLKIAMGPISIRLSGNGVTITSFPSGHAAMSAMFYLGLAALMRTSPSRILWAMTALFFVILTGLIATAMIALDWHSGAEVAAGLLLGAVFAAFPARASRFYTMPPQEVFALGLAAVATIATFHGVRLDTSIDMFRGIPL